MLIIVDKMPQEANECSFAQVNYDDQTKWICGKAEPSCGDRTCCLVNNENCPYLKDLPTAIIESGLIDAGSYNSLVLFNTLQQAQVEAGREDGEHHV